MTRTLDHNKDFTCAHCGYFIPTSPIRSGVNNRNHCPYCLWSRHLDLFEAGDRLSACKAPMQPVGLTQKRSHKKYPGPGGGELMLVHLCTACGRISINRIAADDDPENILAVFHGSTASASRISHTLSRQGITLLTRVQFTLVTRQLYGRRVQPELAFSVP